MKLKDRIAVITGGTGGIGFGVAQAFVEEGATVVITGRTAERGKGAVEQLGGETRAHFVAGNAKDRVHIEGAIDYAVEQFGQLDIMVNNSGGVSAFATIAEMSDESWDEAIRWNLYGPFWGCRRALKYFIPQQFGRIINMSSLEGKHGKPAIAHYASAKHGLHGLTKSLAQEVGPMGITVNAICPGVVLETDLAQSQFEVAAQAMHLTADQLISAYSQETAIKRFISADEIGALAVLLASEAGAAITGATISIDGGSANY
jgi:3-hydroxybutyrate dehydrogenase